MKIRISRRNTAFAGIIVISLLLVTAVSGWFIPRFKNPSGSFVGATPGIGPPGEPPGINHGDVYYAFVFEADRRSNPARMTFTMYWNTYQMFDPRVESRGVYVGECARISKTTWKFRMLAYLGGHHPADPWMANDLVWIIDDSGTFTFTDDFQEVTMDYNQGWYTPGQDSDKDGFPEGEPNGGYWPGTIEAKRITITE
jgi:hypothetical protein